MGACPSLEMPPEEARRGLTEHLLVFMGGTGARRPRAGLGIASTVTVAFPTLIANLALELAPIRVNLIAAGFVDTALSASILGDGLDERRDELRATLVCNPCSCVETHQNIFDCRTGPCWGPYTEGFRARLVQ
jgi:hypothetical protein